MTEDTIHKIREGNIKTKQTTHKEQIQGGRKGLVVKKNTVLQISEKQKGGKTRIRKNKVIPRTYKQNKSFPIRHKRRNGNMVNCPTE